ncbi:MAG: serine/threonine protein kinase, partial [Proteobacteria bacterium]|nr:serine/threonine protein kinase [Pseudomonadota bacterium]
MADMEDVPNPPFSTLTPDCVLSALDSVGLRGDGRLLALNSYENRVYQAGIEDKPLEPVVAKFYRPARWTDAAIIEEHAFVSELAEREIPVVAATPLGGKGTLHRFAGFRFAVFPRRGGRAPNLEELSAGARFHPGRSDGRLSQRRGAGFGRRAALLRPGRPGEEPAPARRLSCRERVVDRN